VVIPVEGAFESIDQKVLIDFLQTYVDDGTITKWAVPDHYVFVEELPRTSVGKIDKKALRLQYSTHP
jgi:fatty-acyl-CoA synthase